MNDDPPKLPRRTLLRYGGVGASLAIAGCGANDDGNADDGTDDGNADDGSDNSTDGGDGDGQSGGPAAEFELAGDGAERYRPWLVPEYALGADSDAETKQLYQFNDYERAADAGWDSPLLFRDRFAEAYGVEPDAFESEVLVGPVENGRPRRILFGSFDTATIADQLESNNVEQTGEDGDFTVFGGQIAVSEEAIVQHDSFEAFLSASRAERETIGETDEDVGLLLDLVPGGALVTLSRRDGLDDVAVDAMSVSEFGEIGRASCRERVFPVV